MRWLQGLLPAVLVVAVCATAATAQTAQAPSAADAAFAEGRSWLAQAQQRAQASRAAILAANRIRQQINALRAGRPAAPGAGSPSPDDLLRELERQQADGARWRAEAETARERAQQHLAEGLTLGWAPWVRDTQPLTLDTDAARFFARRAHNAPLRSVHPNMPDAAAAPVDAEAAAREMSLQLPMLAAQQAPPDLDIAAFQLSRDQHYLAHIEVHADAPSDLGNAAAVPLNRMHRWRLLVSDLAGRPVAGAVIRVTGHMPGHVHGLPTQPRVTRALAPGVYLVEGLKFQMEGWWVMQFHIQPADAGAPADDVAFNLVF